MKTVNFFLLIATTFFIVLIYFMANATTLESQYEILVEEIMEDEGHIREDEALHNYPKLMEIKNKIQRIRKLRSAVRQTTGHPIPPKKEESEELLKQMDTLAFLIDHVQFQMKEISNRKIEVLSSP